MRLEYQSRVRVSKVVKELYQYELKDSDVTINQTKPEFEGDYTVVLFSFVKSLKKAPEQLGKELGEYLSSNHPTLFSSYNVIKGFLNLSITDDYWTNFLQTNFLATNYGLKPSKGTVTVVEYSCP